MDGPEGMRPGTVLIRQQQIPFGDDNRKTNAIQSNALAEAEDWVGDVGFFEGGDLFGGEFD